MRAYVIAAVVIILAGGYFLAPRSPFGTAQEVTIPNGTGARAIGRLLEQAGIIRSPFGFAAYAAVSDQARGLQAGRYLVCACQSVPTIVHLMATGQALTDEVQATIPEGSNIWDVDRIIAVTGLFRPGTLARGWAFKEGHLFPDTYRFAKDATAEDVVRRMEKNYFDKGATRGDIDLIIASMLEKEAKTPEDMALVSGIMHKRLERGMPLQVDATVAYGWCKRTASGGLCDVTQAPIITEIKRDGPYNTYTRKGLPAGPISNPGLAALDAAAHPKASEYLYYLSTRDGSRLIYATTLQEHLANRQKYLGF